MLAKELFEKTMAENNLGLHVSPQFFQQDNGTFSLKIIVEPYYTKEPEAATPKA